MKEYLAWFEKNTNALMDKKDAQALSKLGQAMKQVGMIFQEAGVGAVRRGTDCQSEAGSGGSCESNSCLCNGGGGDCSSNSCLNASGGGDCSQSVCHACASKV
ncbi:MAG: hypothetical protein JXI32_08325 [Deltaproteobacteria bacterium]|nr:hypothetical protein [Deltaproteobacteria bacterium]